MAGSAKLGCSPKHVVGQRVQIMNGKEVKVRVIAPNVHGSGYFQNKAAFKASYEDEGLALWRDIERADEREVEANASRWKLHI